jgi:superfamily II DNA or RNA helicase
MTSDDPHGPSRGERLRLDGELVLVEGSAVTEAGIDLIVRYADGRLGDRSVTLSQLATARVPENDGRGVATSALAGLWGRWMQYTSPRLRSAALATRPLRPYAHQDEAVFSHMLPQPRLRFLLADEPGTGKTIMTGMYLVEGRRRGLIPGPVILVVPAHLVQKWQEELEDFFGIHASRLTPEVARDPKDLDPRVEVWLTSVDLFTHNHDVRRKVAGQRASWSLAVFDEAHRLTPTSRYLTAAAELASRSHHLLLLTATPHRGKEHFFRGLCHLLDPELYPWDPDDDRYDTSLRPSRLTFLRRMKEELKDLNGDNLFPRRYAETIPVALGELELSAYEAVMEYAGSWYGKDSSLALSIYGKRAASSLIAAAATLTRRLAALSGSTAHRRASPVPEGITEGFRGDGPLSAAFENPEDLERAEDVIIGASTRDKHAEIEAVNGVLDQLSAAIQFGGTPAKWSKAKQLMAKHGIKPGHGQLLVFTEFADTARWLAGRYREQAFTAETLEGAVDHRARHELQRRFLAENFQILVSTDAGGEGINLQSAHVMVDWDIPWSLVRLEQRMGRLHRIGQRNDVFIYHLVAPGTREGRVQEVMLSNIEAAGQSLGGRVFDLLDATFARATGDRFDLAGALLRAQADPDASIDLPDVAALKRAAHDLINEDRHLRSRVDQAAADSRFRADRLEAINPVIVDGFFDSLAAASSWTVSSGPAPGIRRVQSLRQLPPALGGGTSRYVAADGGAVEHARSEGSAELDDVIVLGPAENAFGELVGLALDVGRPELLRGCQLVDTGSLTDYMLLIYEAEVRMHDGIRQAPRPAPLLIRWSGAGAFEVSWESLMKLRPSDVPSLTCPTPAQLADGEREAKAALRREVRRQKSERLAWVDKARNQLNDLEDRFLEEIAELPRQVRQARTASFNVLKTDRLAQLSEIEDVRPTAARLAGWAHVAAGVRIEDLGYDPDAEKTAIAKILAELTSLGFAVDDRQTAGVGYDLLARQTRTGEQRCIEVKGQTNELGPVWLEQNEWAQALQRRADYWLYVVDKCGTTPTVRVRTQDPGSVYGSGLGRIQRFQIRLSQLKEQAAQT